MVPGWVTTFDIPPIPSALVTFDSESAISCWCQIVSLRAESPQNSIRVLPPGDGSMPKKAPFLGGTTMGPRVGRFAITAFLLIC
jgi:hypothetical protein